MSQKNSWTIPIIVGLNIVVFLLWNLNLGVSKEFMANNFLISWDGLIEGRFWTLLTSVFSHSEFWHIFMNMFVLTSFGPVVESVLGKGRFISFYIAAGLFSSLCHAYVSNFLLNEPSQPALGASGAIAGVLLLFALLFPKEKILIFGIIPLPAIVGAFAFIGLDIWGLMAQADGGGLPIGHGAHLGGSFIGILYFFYLRARGLRVHISR